MPEIEDQDAAFAASEPNIGQGHHLPEKAERIKPGRKSELMRGVRISKYGDKPARVVFPAQIVDLAQEGATDPEISRCLGISERLLHSKFAAFLREGRDKLAMSIKREQVAVAFDSKHRAQGNMLIWLGKQYCGQSDMQTVSGDGEKPLRILVTPVMSQ